MQIGEILAVWVGVSMLASPVIGRCLRLSTREEMDAPAGAGFEFPSLRTPAYGGSPNHGLSA